MRQNFLYFIYCLLILTFFACHHATKESDEEEVAADQVQTPVTVTSVGNEPLTEYAELNATSVFQQENVVKSNLNGYVKSINTKMGQYVSQGKTLFVLKTKEAESLGNTIDKLDTTFHFSGVTHIAASKSGYITQLSHQVGDYVQDGEQLAVISDAQSFGFILNLPYELHNYVSQNKSAEVILPDGKHLNGFVASFMPAIDSVSQTQQVLIKVPASSTIPENLIAKVRILKTQTANGNSLPKQAVLSNETQTDFWVMKMIDSVTAAKVPVVKGIETKDKVEILRPQFSANDKILLTGNYGLPDTAKVKVIKTE